MVLHGDLMGKEDLLIEGQFQGTINLPENCLRWAREARSRPKFTRAR